MDTIESTADGTNFRAILQGKSRDLEFKLLVARLLQRIDELENQVERLKDLQDIKLEIARNDSHVNAKPSSVEDQVKRSSSPLKEFFNLEDLPVKNEDIKRSVVKKRSSSSLTESANKHPVMNPRPVKKARVHPKVQVAIPTRRPRRSQDVKSKAKTERQSSPILGLMDIDNAAPLNREPTDDLEDPNDYQQTTDESPTMQHVRSRSVSVPVDMDTDTVRDFVPVIDEDEVKPQQTGPTHSTTPDSFVKPKFKEDMSLDEATVRSRIAAISAEPWPVTTDPAVASVSVTRLFMSAEYGGSPVAVFPSIAEARFVVHGFKDFMFMSVKWHPNAPSRPGEPGLWYNPTPLTDAWMEDKGAIQRLFVGLDQSKWLYFGQYKLAPAPSLTQTEWVLQSPKVKNTWGREIQSKSWGKQVRVEVILRRELGREPTRAEIRDAFNSNDRYENVTADEIINAYDEGKQNLGIATLKCVGYDEEFQRKLAQAFPAWVPPQSKSKKGKVKKARRPQGKAAVGDDGNGVEEEEEDDIQIVERPYVKKGTRSRPVV